MEDTEEVPWWEDEEAHEREEIRAEIIHKVCLACGFILALFAAFYMGYSMTPIIWRD